MDFLNTYLIYLIPVFGLVGILAMIVKSAWVTKQETGDANYERACRLHCRWRNGLFAC
jgi:hypothetical protein